MSIDFSGQNLRGRSFKGQDLEGADFSDADIRGVNFKGHNLECADFNNADIRGANFEGANLQGANFTGAKAGMQKRWALFFVCASIPYLVLSNMFFLLNGVLISLIFFYSETLYAIWEGLIITIIVYVVLIRKGLGVVSFNFNGSFSFGVPILALAATLTLAGAINLIEDFVIDLAAVLAIAGALAGVLAGAFT